MTKINWITPQQWAAALRSPDRPKQVTGSTIDFVDGGPEVGFCCLGILCKESGAETHIPPDRLYKFPDLMFRFEGEAADLEASGWLGGTRPEWLSSEKATEAGQLNDSARKSFDEIADWIDEEWADFESPS